MKFNFSLVLACELQKGNTKFIFSLDIAEDMLVKNQLDENNCDCESSCNLSRRNALKLTTGLILGIASGISPNLRAEEENEAHPDIGDYLADADAEGKPVALNINDIVIGGKPIVAYPFNPKTGVLKDGSRLNKVLLLRVATDSISEDIVKNSADGVLAYSGVCTHKGCDITSYNAKDNAIICFCHFSKFQPTSGGEVLSGPAPRNLPMLPIKLDNQNLVVAGQFLSRPGATN
jgi:rieske iron-sulfur protein